MFRLHWLKIQKQNTHENEWSNREEKKLQAQTHTCTHAKDYVTKVIWMIASFLTPFNFNIRQQTTLFWLLSLEATYFWSHSPIISICFFRLFILFSNISLKNYHVLFLFFFSHFLELSVNALPSSSDTVEWVECNE